MKIIRIETENDIIELTNLAPEIWREYCVSIIGHEQTEYMIEKFHTKEFIEQQIENGCQYYFIEAENKKAGYIAVIPEQGDLFLSKFYIKQVFRGKGLGRKTLKLIEDIAKELNLPKIRLVCNKYNKNSLAVYKKLGFNIVDSTIIDIGGGYKMDDYVLEKAVD